MNWHIAEGSDMLWRWKSGELQQKGNHFPNLAFTEGLKV
jgi:hypothetical protein